VDPACAQAGRGSDLSDGYLGDERLNELARLCISLMREVWLLRDRQVLLEKVLADRELIDATQIDAFDPDPQMEERLRLEVDRFVERIFRTVFRDGPPDLEELTRRVRAELEDETRLTARDDLSRPLS